jgi:nucleotide-binding universal stress UspA family protein
MEVRTILAPVDFSDHSARALDTAISIAKIFGAKVQLLHCYPLPAAVVAPYGGTIPMDLERDVRNAAAKQIEEWVGKVVAAGVEGQGFVTSAPAVRGILDRADDVGADLIVMGTRGLSGLKHVVLGSVAERTIRLAKCPVLTLKADAD